jgi:hypothetical protein
MGRLLVILLVMLLPLRGWSAERMAIQMTQSQAIVEVIGDRVSMAGMPADCPMIAQTSSEAEKSPTVSKSHSGCLTCQLCMSLASPDTSSPHLMAHERQAPPVSISVSFISADLTRQGKPPNL